MIISKIQNYNNNSQPSFSAKVSSNFMTIAQNFYNYNNIPNKRSLIWQLNDKAKEYESYGYNNYVLDYEKKLEQGNFQHYLVATDANNPTNKIYILKRQTIFRLINAYKTMSNYKFRQIMKDGIKNNQA